ncbi:phosphatase PAP2 family protein [Pullulanibacillus camelliae]|uniref:phosphatase PAP2 family protein n=1 Tax=Pullulanibacillus camelliae TaxID=1707096 RepID=UPI00166734F5|nr:phosphatase PAP2 family protein [Pullulanibacillus camelliae]
MSLHKSFKLSLYILGFFLLTALFFIVAHYYNHPVFHHFNRQIQSGLYNAYGRIGFDFFGFFTYVGSIYLALPLTLILVFYTLMIKRYMLSLLLLYNFFSVRFFNAYLKQMYQEPRPTLAHLLPASSYSFPSGHAMNAIAFFGFLAFLLVTAWQTQHRRCTWIWLIASCIIVCIGLSRIYLGVHFPTDILGGYLAGGACLMITLVLYTLFVKRPSDS